MKYLIALTWLASACAFGSSAMASESSSCHFHGSKPAAESTVAACASQRKDALVASGKLASAWGAVKHESVAAVEGKKGKEWKVTFKDPAATDKRKETLYMFFTLPGNFIAANFTGQ